MKKRMITRTIKVTHATVMALDIETAEPFNMVIDIIGTCNNEADMLNKCKVIADTERVKVVTVVGSEVEELLYGMSDQEFIKHAEILPPRKKSEDENESEVE